MDFAALTPGCKFRHVTWPIQYVRVESIPTAQERKAGKLPVLVFVNFDGSESDWLLTTHSIVDRGFILTSGELSNTTTGVATPIPE